MSEQEKKILKVRNLKKFFGGIKAVNGVSFEVSEKEHLGIIGPNGAGKTTLFNVIAGKLKANAGEVIFQGENVIKKPARKRALSGISRTFQTSQLFLDLTVKENLFLAANKNKGTFNILTAWKKDEKIIEKSVKVAEKLGLADLLENKVAELPHGKRRLLGIGQALISEAELIMLDEPAAGLPAQERTEISNLIKNLTEDITLIIIDHDMDIIFDIADRVLVLNRGEVLAIDEPENIKKNQKVQEIYVGGKADAG